MKKMLAAKGKNKFMAANVVKEFYESYDFENPSSWLKFAMVFERAVGMDEYLNRQTNEPMASPMIEVRVLQKSIKPIRKTIPLKALAVLKRSGQYNLEDYEAS